MLNCPDCAAREYLLELKQSPLWLYLTKPKQMPKFLGTSEPVCGHIDTNYAPITATNNGGQQP